MNGPRRLVVVGSHNPGKVREIQKILAALPVELRSLDDYPDAVPPEEIGETFAENARLKARELARQTGAWVLADDSGLCVDALDGRPGVRSARYGGPGASDEQKAALLLGELRDVPDEERGAAFVCAIALASPDEVVVEAEGRCAGRITRQPRGRNGFGYDPVFFYPAFGSTFAEAAPGDKNRVSHRGVALRALASSLAELLGHAP